MWVRLYGSLSEGERDLIKLIHDINIIDVERAYLDEDNIELEEDGKIYMTLIIQLDAVDDSLCIRKHDLELYKHCESVHVDFETHGIQLWFTRLCEDMIKQGFYMPDEEVLEKMGLDIDSPLDEIAKRHNEYVINEYKRWDK